MNLYVKVIVFLVASGYLAWLSRRSLRSKTSHGFYRFFAWETILCLVLLNLNRWFDQWLSLRQIASWMLLALSGYLIIHGVIALYRSGKPADNRTDPALIGIEKTTALVTTGIYRFVRHPIYASAVVGVWGVVLKDISAPAIFLAMASVALLTATAKKEEAENLNYFGKAYSRYMEKTTMFVPYVF